MNLIPARLTCSHIGNTSFKRAAIVSNILQLFFKILSVCFRDFIRANSLTIFTASYPNWLIFNRTETSFRGDCMDKPYFCNSSSKFLYSSMVWISIFFCCKIAPNFSISSFSFFNSSCCYLMWSGTLSSGIDSDVDISAIWFAVSTSFCGSCESSIFVIKDSIRSKFCPNFLV